MALLAPIVLSACVGTETGNPPFTAGLTIDAHSSDPAVASIGAGTGTVIEEAWLVVGDVSLVDGDTCSAPLTVTSLGAADHAAAGHVEAEVELMERTFCRVEVAFLRAEGELPPEAPPELAGASIVLTGETSTGTELVIVGTAAPKVAGDALDSSFELAGEEPGVFLGFDVATWLDGIDLDAATVGMDGRIHVDDDDNTALARAFEANLAGGLELFPDDDRDGMPDGPPVARGAP